ncbi:MAG: hypothetical protein JMN24_13590 [gamma proteobacterium endosymbiont of Lamellibrachia anaximandri]|nr:hypothetical protein [gamma proteobacterium endosymbiont of Lamellibrachia anaximandri]
MEKRLHLLKDRPTACQQCLSVLSPPGILKAAAVADEKEMAGKQRRLIIQFPQKRGFDGILEREEFLSCMLLLNP